MASGKCEEGVRMASGWRQETSGFSNRVRKASGCVRMASGWRQDGVRQASEVWQGSGVGVRSMSGCVRMRQEGVRVASGGRQDNLASGWRQDGVKGCGAQIKCRSGHSLACSLGLPTGLAPEVLDESIETRSHLLNRPGTAAVWNVLPHRKTTGMHSNHLEFPHTVPSS